MHEAEFENNLLLFPHEMLLEVANLLAGNNPTRDKSQKDIKSSDWSSYKVPED
jgi:hypothetical protein